MTSLPTSQRRARQPWWRRWFGTRSERAAARFLRGRGMRIITRNYSCAQGEIDLVGRDGSCLVFVEVRSTEGEDVERPALSVDLVKQRRLTKLALSFLQRYRLLGCSARFDVVAVSWPPGRKPPVIVHYADAFPPTDRFQLYS